MPAQDDLDTITIKPTSPATTASDENIEPIVISDVINEPAPDMVTKVESPEDNPPPFENNVPQMPTDSPPPAPTTTTAPPVIAPIPALNPSTQSPSLNTIDIKPGFVKQPEIPEIKVKTSPTVDSSKEADLLSILQKNNKITKQQVDEIRLQQLNTGKNIETLLQEMKIVSPRDIAKSKAELFEIPFIQANELTVSPEAIQLIPRSVAQKFIVLAFDLNKETNELSVAMADPTDLQVIGFLEQKTNTHLKPFAADKEELTSLIQTRYKASISSEVKKVIKDTEVKKTDKPSEIEPGVVQQAPISKIVSYILSYAINTRASDIHIEPEEEKTRVRYRIDGILYEKLILPRGIHEALISKIKIMSKMKIDERRIPQDGRFNFTGKDQEIDLRVSTLPTVHGEKVVIRLLKKTGGSKTLPELGLRGKALKNLEEAILRPHGIILVCGPTGSGKTTTLYSLISKINSPKVNIMTLEDPVEYEMKGVNQVQINPVAGLTFASGLKSFLRQDPNVIMVGEIRDKETTELAIQASLTGHLVFSTLHTNNSAGSLPRLLDMGAEPFLLSSTINAVVAQRVVRVICNNCKVKYPASEEVLDDIKKTLGNLYPQKAETTSLSKGKGCSECNNTGYQGRIGIFEVLTMSERIAKQIMERTPAGEIEKEAINHGMLTMKQDGYLKVLEGITTIEEVLRVAQD